MTASLDLSGLHRIQARLDRIENFDATPLMRTWMQIIDDDNRRGVLAGTDKDGNPMKAVTYRPLKAGAEALTVAQRLGQAPRTKRGKYVESGVKGNLTSYEYRRLDGPPLAPRRQFSRVITNLLTDYDDGQRSSGRWEAWGYWDGVVSTKGVPFLIYHFEGQGHNPQRDLRGLRAEGRDRAQKALRAWAIDMVRTRGDEGVSEPAPGPMASTR